MNLANPGIGKWIGISVDIPMTWAPTMVINGVKWGPYKWPYKWVTGVVER